MCAGSAPSRYPGNSFLTLSQFIGHLPQRLPFCRKAPSRLCPIGRILLPRPFHPSQQRIRSRAEAIAEPAVLLAWRAPHSGSRARDREFPGAFFVLARSVTSPCPPIRPELRRLPRKTFLPGLSRSPRFERRL